MKKMILTGLLAGLLMIVAGGLLNLIFGWTFPSFQAIYENTDIFLPMDGARSLLFWVYPFVLGIALAKLYGGLKKEFQKPLKFSCIYFVVAALPALFINVGSFNLPVMMVVTWTIMSYVNGLIAAYLFNKMLK